jgi:ATP-dependent Clp protease protease subunit
MAKLMDAETWINGSAAVEKGFADELLPSDQVKQGSRAMASAVRRVESALRAAGMPKSEAMRLISEIKSSAGDPAGNGAGDPTGTGQQAEATEEAVLAALRSFNLT